MSASYEALLSTSQSVEIHLLCCVNWIVFCCVRSLVRTSSLVCCRCEPVRSRMPETFETPSENYEDDQMSVDEHETQDTNIRTKKKKPGIIYLSTIPQNMTAAYLRDLLSNFGEIGRVYLQEDVRDVAKSANKKKKRKKKTYSRNYSEGWIEFKSKRVAKEVANVLNNTQIGGRKKSKFYDCIWTIKYLPRFKWTHLSERLAYEKAVHKQRMRAEIYQAKREADYFSLNVDKSEMLKKKGRKSNYDVNSPVEIRQRETEDQILKKKKSMKNDKGVSKANDSSDGNVNNRDDFLKSLFSY